MKKSALALSSNISSFDLLFCSFVLIKICTSFSSLKKIIDKNQKSQKIIAQ